MDSLLKFCLLLSFIILLSVFGQPFIIHFYACWSICCSISEGFRSTHSASACNRRTKRKQDAEGQLRGDVPGSCSPSLTWQEPSLRSTIKSRQTPLPSPLPIMTTPLITCIKTCLELWQCSSYMTGCQIKKGWDCSVGSQATELWPDRTMKV